MKIPSAVGGGLPGVDLLSNPLGSLGLQNIGGLGTTNLPPGNLGLPMMQNPLLGLGLNIPPPQNYNQRPQTTPSNILVPGSQQHAHAFHAKGPDFEIKLFVGGLAFQTSGMYYVFVNYDYIIV